YVTRSSARARHREQARLRRARLVATGALVLSALAVAGGAYAFIQKKAADRERVAAVEQKVIAEGATATALESQVRTAYLLGNENLRVGKTRDGLASLAHALAIEPQHQGVIDRLYSYHLYGLPKAIPILSATGPAGERQWISGAVRGPVQRILYQNGAGLPEVFDLGSKEVVPGKWSKEPDSFASVIMEDGTLVLNIRKDMTARFWDVPEEGQAEASPPTQIPANFVTLSCTRDSRHFLYCTPDGTAHVFNVKDSKPYTQWKQKGSRLSFRETDDGAILSTSGEDFVRYDLEEKKITATRVDPDHLISTVQTAAKAGVAAIVRQQKSADGQPMASGDIIFVDSVTLETIPNSRDLHWTGFPPLESAFRVSSSGDMMVVATNRHSVKVVHQTDPEKDITFDLPVNPVFVRLSPDERLVICNTPDGTVRIFDTKTKKLAFEPISHDGTIQDLNLSWDGRYLLTSTGDRSRVWDLSVGPALSLPVVVTDEIRSSALSPDGRFITGHNGGIRRWDLTQLKADGPLLHPDPKGLACLLDATGEHAAVLFEDNKVRFIRISEPEGSDFPVWESPEPVSYWGFSQDGTRFFSNHEDLTRHVDTKTGKQIGEALKLPGPFQNIFFVPGTNDTVIYHAAEKNGFPYYTVKLRAADNSGYLPLEVPECNIGTLAISQDGRWLLAGCNSIGLITEFYALVWDLRDPSATPRKFPHPGVVSAIDASPDGKYVAIGGLEQTVRIWPIDGSQSSPRVLDDPLGVINLVKFSPDSDRLATISVRDQNSSIKVWDWKEGSIVNQPLEYPVIAEQVHFTDGGHKLLIVRPSPQDTAKRELIVIEIRPPADLKVDFRTLTQAAIAMEVDKDGVAVPTDPYAEWNKVRAASPDSWFLKAPAKRNISPALSADSGRWMLEDAAVTIDELSFAMPAVGLSRAAIAYWYQLNLNRREAELKNLDPKSTAYEEKQRHTEDLRGQIHTLVEFGKRNAPGDAAVCYYLSMWARAAGEKAEAAEYIRQALALEPDNLNYLNHSALVLLDGGDLAEERRTLEHILKLKPGDPLNQIRLGYNLWRTGGRPKAKELFAASIDWPEISIHDKAAILSHLERKEESLAAYQKIADDLKEASPDKKYDTDACVYLILGNFQAGKKDQAIAYFRDLLKLAPAANDADVIEGSNLLAETKEVLKKVLALTLARHPELAPGAEGQ
ncbi:MAG: hypothetical protein EOP87_05610, partial [Verrucomicrobiaceae bacterium]